MKWFHYTILLILLTGGGVIAYQYTRGIRNKNPGNIRYNPANDWNGQTGQDSDGFVIFSDSRFGIRAMGKILDSYRGRGVTSIREIISSWAPNSENDTESYISSVVQSMNAPSYHFTPTREDGDYPALVKAIIKHENGINPYSDGEIIAGLDS